MCSFLFYRSLKFIIPIKLKWEIRTPLYISHIHYVIKPTLYIFPFGVPNWSPFFLSLYIYIYNSLKIWISTLQYDYQNLLWITLFVSRVNHSCITVCNEPTVRLSMPSIHGTVNVPFPVFAPFGLPANITINICATVDITIIQSYTQCHTNFLCSAVWYTRTIELFFGVTLTTKN